MADMMDDTVLDGMDDVGEEVEETIPGKPEVLGHGIRWGGLGCVTRGLLCSISVEPRCTE